MLISPPAPYVMPMPTEIDLLFEWKKAIGSELADLRSEAGISQPQLAKLLGMSRGTISNIERGLSNSPIDVFLNFCLVLKEEYGVEANFGLLCARAAFTIKGKTMSLDDI